MSDLRTLTYIYHYAFACSGKISGDGIYKTLDMISGADGLLKLKDHVEKKHGAAVGVVITSLSRIGELHYV